MKMTTSAFTTGTLALYLSVFLTTFQASAEPPSRPLQAVMVGSETVPDAGDEDGKGVITLALSARSGEVGFTIEVADIDNATAVEICSGYAGEEGPVVLKLLPPTNQKVSAILLDVESSLIRDILRRPAAFYVVVKTSLFPEGALRGQLTKQVLSSNQIFAP